MKIGHHVFLSSQGATGYSILMKIEATHELELRVNAIVALTL